MASKDNKGFSLTEVVVSVAVLLLLLSPILSQMLTSIKTQSLAKERLYALENANSVLENFKSASIKDIEAGKGSVFETEKVVSGRIDSLPANDTSETCDLYIEDTSGHIVKLASGIKYNYTDYILKDATFAKGQYNYSRVVTVDDLANKIKSFETTSGADTKHYSIVYDLDESYGTKTIDGYTFERTNEGSYVAYGYKQHTGNDKQEIAHVKAILVKENPVLNTTYSDPNAIDLGHIQDLDETKVAIIEGVSSNFDTQAEEDFYSLKLQHLKELNYKQFQRIMTQEGNENIFTTVGYNETVNKLTTIVLSTDTDDSGVKFYNITVNVTYEDKYGLTKADGTEETEHDNISYRVYSQDFYTNRCPDVYLMYEPYVYNSGVNKVQYRSKDYIAVDNQLEFSLVAEQKDEEGNIIKESYIDESAGKEVVPNIYVIRPDDTKFDKEKPGYETEATFVSQIASKTTNDVYENVYYTDIDATATWKPVHIDIFQLGSNTTTEPKKIIPIYTDIKFTFDSDESDNDKLQLFSIQKPVTFNGTDPFEYSLKNIETKEYDVTRIKDIAGDSREGDGRLYTATVTYRRLNKDGSVYSGYDIRFQSGKGAD